MSGNEYRPDIADNGDELKIYIDPGKPLYSYTDLQRRMLDDHPHQSILDPQSKSTYSKQFDACSCPGIHMFCCLKKSLFIEYGIGVDLYFKYLQYFTIIFFLFSIVFAFPIVLYYYGDINVYKTGYNDYISGSTVANLLSGRSITYKYDNPTFPFPVNCSRGSIKNITAEYGKFSGTVDCPKNRLPRKDSNSLPDLWEGENCDKACNGSIICLQKPHPVSLRPCCYTSMGSYESDHIIIEALGPIYVTKCLGMSSCYITDDEVEDSDLFAEGDNNSSLIVNITCYLNELRPMINKESLFMDKPKFIFFLSTIDFLFVIAMLIIIFILNRFESEAVSQLNIKVNTVRDFTVLVSNLPKHSSISEIYTILRDHFGTLIVDSPLCGDNKTTESKIADINFCYVNQDLGLSLFKKRGDALKEIESLDHCKSNISDSDFNTKRKFEKKISKLQNDLKLVDAQISSWEATLTARSAFITFENTSHKTYILELYKKNTCRVCFCCACSSKKFKIRKNKIIVRECTEPSDVNWTHSGVNPCTSCCMSLFTSLLSIVLLLISFIILFSAKRIQRNISGTNTDVDCQSLGPISSEEVVQDLYPDLFSNVTDGIGEKGLLQCYCTRLLYSGDFSQFSDSKFGINVDKLPSTDWDKGTDEYSCNSWLSDFVLNWSLSIGSILIILIFNSCISFLIYRIISYEKNESETARLASLLTKIFISQFFNTALITLVVAINLSSFGININIFGLTFFDGSYSPFSLDWYRTIGVSLIYTMILNMITINFGAIANALFYKCRICFDRGCSCNKFKTKQTTKDGLYSIYTGPAFLIESNYATTLNIFFIVITFCLGLPLLLLIGFFAFLFKFLVDKLAFVRLYKTPPNYDESLARKSTNLLKHAVFLHLIFSLFIFNDQEAFQEVPAFIDKIPYIEQLRDIAKTFSVSSSARILFIDFGVFFQQIYYQLNVTFLKVPHLALLFIFFLLYYIISSPLFGWMSGIFNICKTKAKSKNLPPYTECLDQKYLNSFSTAIYKKPEREVKYKKEIDRRLQNTGTDSNSIILNGIQSYDLCANPKYLSEFALNSSFSNSKYDELIRTYTRPLTELLSEKRKLHDQYRKLIKTIRNESKYPLQTFEELFGKMAGGSDKISFDALLCGLGYKSAKDEKNRNLIEMRASQLFNIFEIEKEARVSKEDFVVNLYKYFDNCGDFEINNFRAMFTYFPGEDVYKLDLSRLTDKRNIPNSTSKYKDIVIFVSQCTDLYVNGKYNCFGLFNGAPHFKNENSNVTLNRYYNQQTSSYYWVFLYYTKGYDSNEPIKPSMWLYQTNEYITNGYPPVCGFTYRNPHEPNKPSPTIRFDEQMSASDQKREAENAGARLYEIQQHIIALTSEINKLNQFVGQREEQLTDFEAQKKQLCNILSSFNYDVSAYLTDGSTAGRSFDP